VGALLSRTRDMKQTDAVISHPMGLTIDSVRFGKDDVFSGYAAYPDRAALPLPAIVVIQEAWGVDAHIEDVTRRFAHAGYVTFAPDVFARDGKRPAPLTKERITEFLTFFNTLPPAAWMDTAKRDAAIDGLSDEAQRARIRETLEAIFSGARSDAHLEPVLAATKFVRESYAPSRGKRVGTVGFCMGGRLSARAACADAELSAAVMCYGTSPPDELVGNIACPILALYGRNDTRINDTVPAFQEAAKKHGKQLECVFYEGAGHAFFNDTRPSYDVNAARAAFSRILAFFQATLC